MATIEKRNNAYKITVSCGYDVNGKQLRQYTTWTPPQGMSRKQEEKELQRQAMLFEEQCKQGRCIGGNIRFADFAEFWLREYAEKQLKFRTVEDYRFLLKRIVPAIGHIRIGDLQPSHLMMFYSDLSQKGVKDSAKYHAEKLDVILQNQGIKKSQLADASGVCLQTVRVACKGDNVSAATATAIASALGLEIHDIFTATNDDECLSGKTIIRYHRTISSMLQQAVYWQMIPSNPCSRVKAPKATPKEARHLDEKQAQELLIMLESAPEVYKTFVTLLLFSGLRRGEACGLEWQDIDFENNLLYVRRNTLYTPKKGLFDDTPKTEGSERVIKLPDLAINTLKQHKAVQRNQRYKMGDKWHANNKVFTGYDGKPIYPDTFSSWFRDFVKKNNLPDICLHSLRHTNATLLIASGTNLTTVAKRLGHANTATTARIYAHAIQTADEMAADTLQDILTIKHA
ncbi:MAG: site-specific integrase [Clostridiales bacterium]|nr:site-specific integrase [Clostridiales bacterium]